MSIESQENPSPNHYFELELNQMAVSMITKRSPIVLIRNLVAIEAVAFIFYLIATQLDEYKFQIYRQIPLSRLFSYEMTSILFLFSIQLFITIYAFLRWHSESYLIRPSAISHKTGIIFKKNKTVPLEKSTIVSSSSGPLGKIFRYGSICLEDASSRVLLNLSDIPRPKKYLKIITDWIKISNKKISEKPDISRILSEEEHEGLEFKSSFRFDVQNREINHDLEKAAMKTVAALLNSNGGHLVIGVNDSREPIGIESDYNALGRKNSDGFENHFTQIFNKMIGPEFRHFIKLWFHKAKEREICVVHVLPSARPVYLKCDNNEHFYIRTGNVSTPLKLSETEFYSRSRWPERFNSV